MLSSALPSSPVSVSTIQAETCKTVPPSYASYSSEKLLDRFIAICESLRGVSKDKRVTVRITFGTFECVGAGTFQGGVDGGVTGGECGSHESRDTLFKKYFAESVKSKDLTREDLFTYLSNNESKMRFTLFLTTPLESHLSDKTIGDGLCCPRVLEMLRKRYEFYQKYGGSSAKSFVPIDYNLFDEKQRNTFIEKAFDPELVSCLSETNKNFVTLAKDWVTKSDEDDTVCYSHPHRTVAQLRDAYISYMSSYPRLPSTFNGLPIWADQDYCRQVFHYNKFPRTLFVEDVFGHAKVYEGSTSWTTSTHPPPFPLCLT
jgi:hypothetical protein